MLTKNIRKARQQAMSRKSNSFSLVKEDIEMLMRDNFNNSLKDIGTFDATVLSIKQKLLVTEAAANMKGVPRGINQPANFYEVVVRPSWFKTPAPWTFKDFEISDNTMTFGPHSKAAVDAHPIARSNSPTNFDQTALIKVGQIVVCTFGTGVDNQGRFRDIRFDLNSTGRIDEDVEKSLRSKGAGAAFFGGFGRRFGGTSSTSFSGGGQTLGNVQANQTTYNRPSIIEGDEFVVGGVRFKSVPTRDAAARAEEFYRSAIAATPEGQYHGDAGKNWERRNYARKWLRDNIYEPMMPGKGQRYADFLKPNKEGKTPRKSHWSSWFWKAALSPYRGKFGRTISKDGYSYNNDEGVKYRREVLKNPKKYIGKELFLTFQLHEAPVFPGDSTVRYQSWWKNSHWELKTKRLVTDEELAFWDLSRPTSKNDLGFEHQILNNYTKEWRGGNRVRVHMQIIVDDAYVIGGNEGRRVKKSKIILNNNNTLKANPGDYIGVYKRVKVIGLANA